jgi:hypothetical protein
MLRDLTVTIEGIPSLIFRSVCVLYPKARNTADCLIPVTPFPFFEKSWEGKNRDFTVEYGKPVAMLREARTQSFRCLWRTRDIKRQRLCVSLYTRKIERGTAPISAPEISTPRYGSEARDQILSSGMALWR